MAIDTVSHKCNRCENEKPWTNEFFFVRTSTGRLGSLCRDCYNEERSYFKRALRAKRHTCLFCEGSNTRTSPFCSDICRALYKIGGYKKRFGRLVVVGVERRESDDPRKYFIQCVCDCGKTHYAAANNLKKLKSCGCARWATPAVGSEHPGWKGGRHQLKSGYIMLYKPGHPNARWDGYGGTKHSDGKIYVAEHVYVMSEYLGRPLRKGETVHHKNGQRGDNRLNNLELWSSSHPYGQRVEDLVAWAKEILAQYEPELPKLAAIGA